MMPRIASMLPPLPPRSTTGKVLRNSRKYHLRVSWFCAFRKAFNWTSDCLLLHLRRSACDMWRLLKREGEGDLQNESVAYKRVRTVLDSSAPVSALNVAPPDRRGRFDKQEADPINNRYRRPDRPSSHLDHGLSRIY